jgi:hypothetical protein
MPAESILTELQTKTLDRKESGPAPDANQGPFFWFLSAMQRLKSLIAGPLDGAWDTEVLAPFAVIRFRNV